MGPILMLSWLARLKFGVKMTVLTPFGGLRGTKFALKDALGAPSWTPREPKRATVGTNCHVVNVGAPGLAYRYLSKLRYQYYRTVRTGGRNENKDLSRR